METTQQTWTKAQAQALADFMNFTHQIWSPEGVAEYGKTFGVEFKTRTFANEPHNPKGAHLRDDDGNPIDKAEALDTEGMVDQLAKALGHKWSDDTLSYFGRGTTVRAKVRELVELRPGEPTDD